MSDTECPVAQLVMKREDGMSILNQPRDAGAGSGDVSEARAEEIVHRVEALGFKVESRNLNTLSISASAVIFEQVFGLEVKASSHGTAAHATQIPDELEDSVADVFVTPSPEFMP